MSLGKQSIDVPHKCLVSKCKGYLDPTLNFGEWAYWHPYTQDQKGGWKPYPPEGMSHEDVPLDKTPVHQ